MRKGLGWLALASVVAFVCPVAVQAEVLPFGLKVEKVLDNTNELGNIAESPTGELWVIERAGTIRVLVAGVQKLTFNLPVTTACQGGLLDVAFRADYAASGHAFVYYVDTANRARVDEIHRLADRLELGHPVLDLGPAGDDCRPGGDLIVGKDGKLYVATGDLSQPSEPQKDTCNIGKVLRANPDGTVPADNPSGTLVWAKGFRNPHGLAYNPETARPGGTFYATDVGQAASPSASDEVNQVQPGGNYGWSLGSGSMGAPYVDPLVTWGTASLVNPISATALHHGHLGPALQNALAVATPTNDAANKGKIVKIALTGAELAQFGSQATLFDPAGDTDGTPDTLCPTKVNVVEMGDDGALYLANTGDNKGIWRIWRDTPGPREVSPPGSPFGLTVAREGASLRFGWENLGTLDAGRAKRYASGQRPETYRIFEGSLPIANASDYDHAAVLSTNGAADGPARRTATLMPGGGNRYYLLGAQGDNLEGTLGAASGGSARPLPGQRDYCDTIGWAKGGTANIGKCMKDFTRNDGTPLKLIDYNPQSPTFRQAVSLADFRGRVIRVDLSALDCGWCQNQARCFEDVERKNLGRDAVLVTIMMRSYGDWSAIPPAECEARIAAWQATYKEKTPILCDVDQDGVTGADAARQISPGGCGTPENFYIDQGFVQYHYACGAEDYAIPPIIACRGTINTTLAPEVNPETCE